MNGFFKKAGLGVALAATALTAAAPADAQRWGGYRHYNRGGGDAVAGALLGGVLGLLQREPEEFLKAGAGEGELTAEQIEALIQARRDARTNKNWAESDRIRDELIAKGVVLEDNAQGTSWRRA